jgi:CheY-like chemotaxis protein
MERRPTVLVVEDNKTEQRLLTLLLDRFGFDAVIASSGIAALEQISDATKNFDLILMDWQMTDMDGLECTKLVRQVQAIQGRYTPIVAVTARAMLGDKQRCLAAGMDDYLSKPYTASDFKSMVAEWTSRSQALTG